MRSITIISATNRPASNTEKVARHYESALKQSGPEVRFLSLTQLPAGILQSDLYGQRSPEMELLINTYITPAEGFIFVVPEYNGSFPGVLKVLLDAVPPRFWNDKHACLVGVSTGRAGNLRGMEHLTNILHYLKMHVYHNKLPISRVDTLFGAEGLHDAETAKVIDAQLQGFLKL